MSEENSLVTAIRFQWKVSQLMTPSGTWLFSKFFKFSHIEGVKFRLCLLRIKGSIFHGKYSAKIERVGSIGDKVHITLTFSEKETITLIDWDKFSESYAARLINYLPSSITCVIKITQSKYFVRYMPELMPPNLNKYLFSPELSDVILKVENKEVPAHTLVLACNSPVFAAVLKINAKNKCENCIDVEEFNADTVEKAMKFLYSGKLELGNDVHLLLKLLSFAEVYEVDRLKKFCECKLVACMSVDNVVGILVAIEYYDAVDLKTKALKFMSKNKVDLRSADVLRHADDSKLLQSFILSQRRIKNLEKSS
ncbi:TD and POZ domain-containing protein 1-like [Microplitis mediator]|uniref:TD and POZ domain-containing protein 1-like n=1 Tax=Microplitis mediator TaxID=375433 RepID=UPI002556B2B3|nr:TD and POZ domain-containing protein 1-like [Microplitis mediator]